MAEVNEVNYSKGGKMGEGGGKGKLIKMIVVAIIALLIVGGGIAAAIMFLGGKDDEVVATAGSDESVIDRGVCESDHLRFLPLGSFIVNLADGRLYLKTNIELRLCDEKVEEVSNYLTTRMPEVKDMIISELQLLSSEQLRDPKEREELKKRLLDKLLSLLPTKDTEWESPDPIKAVLITEFYLQ